MPRRTETCAPLPRPLLPLPLLLFVLYPRPGHTQCRIRSFRAFRSAVPPSRGPFTFAFLLRVSPLCSTDKPTLNATVEPRKNTEQPEFRMSAPPLILFYRVVVLCSATWGCDFLADVDIQMPRGTPNLLPSATVGGATSARCRGQPLHHSPGERKKERERESDVQGVRGNAESSDF